MWSKRMFMGEYDHSLDAKGRLIIPAKLREELGESFVVTKNLDGCLDVYTGEGWANFVEKLGKLPYIGKQAREVKRFFLSGAGEMEPDKQGRIILPLKLREYAGIHKDVVLMGVGDRVEIWGKERWLAADSTETIGQLAEELLGNGFIV